ncbi:MAG TPA: lytic transglycosylase domain-containing protein [Candidatus Angelobacter sp.]|jgi:soluble lytic murein transglycosylase-like protein|nr:lytic transglycosylase domain-containing protein [Candidatus Angelobacter sp.]
MPTIDLRQAIIGEANRQGVDPAIALAVATRESGVMQWYPNGKLVTGKAGEIGIFQIMPSSAPGYDLTDPLQNIAAGVAYLALMRDRYGDWRLALAGYNWGPGNVDKYVAGNASLPSSVNGYITDVMSKAGIYTASLQIKQRQQNAADQAQAAAADPAAGATFPSATFPSSPALSGSKPAIIAGVVFLSVATWLAIS